MNTLDRIAQAIGHAAGRDGSFESWPLGIREHYRRLARAAVQEARVVQKTERRRGVFA